MKQQELQMGDLVSYNDYGYAIYIGRVLDGLYLIEFLSRIAYNHRAVIESEEINYIPINENNLFMTQIREDISLVDLSKSIHPKEAILSMLRGDVDSRKLAIQLLKNDGIL